MAKKRKESTKEEKVIPTPEFLNKFEVVEEDTQRAGQKRMRVVNQRWIDIYYRKKLFQKTIIIMQNDCTIFGKALVCECQSLQICNLLLVDPIKARCLTLQHLVFPIIIKYLV